MNAGRSSKQGAHVPISAARRKILAAVCAKAGGVM
jgi:hypothetical protein